MKTFTQQQWNALPKKAKGRISHAAKFDRLKRAIPDREMIGRRTLKLNHRLLVEGLGFVIVDESLV